MTYEVGQAVEVLGPEATTGGVILRVAEVDGQLGRVGPSWFGQDGLHVSGPAPGYRVRPVDQDELDAIWIGIQLSWCDWKANRAPVPVTAELVHAVERVSSLLGVGTPRTMQVEPDRAGEKVR